MDKLNIRLTLSESCKQVPFGTRVKDIIDSSNKSIIAALYNNEIISLHSRLFVNGELSPVNSASLSGIRVYKQTLSFILEMAARSCFPDKQLVVNHSYGNAFFYHFENNENISQDELSNLEKVMHSLIDNDFDIYQRVVSYKDALEYIASQQQPDTALLLEHLNKNQIQVNQCDDFMALAFSPLAPSTGLIKTFAIKPYRNGFLLRYPDKENLEVIPEFIDFPQLFTLYQQHKQWGKMQDMNCIGKLNRLCSQKKDISAFINVAEALQDKQIADIADDIGNSRENTKLVLIAGPSSSGKTTFTKKLSIQLEVLGFKPILVSLDDYYLTHDKVPVDENGDIDLEAVEALDIPLLNQNLNDLFCGKEAELPRFDFKTATRFNEGRKMKLKENQIILMEGIHGLNDKLTAGIDPDKKFRIYISALTQLNLDDHNRIPTTDNRMIRRMVRDYQFRGYNAKKTIQIWPSVRRGEDRNIFPFQNSADRIFNSALDYELAVLKVFAEPLLRSVKPLEPEYNEACRLLKFLNHISPIPSDMVPKLSILREFIGNSGFKY